MAKLIGHYFCPDKNATFATFEVDGLKETAEKFSKIKGETTDGTPSFLCESWIVMPKAELGKLRLLWRDFYAMYATQEDMPRFKALLSECLRKRVLREKEHYQAAVRLLDIATGHGAPPQTGNVTGLAGEYGTIAVDFDGTLCVDRFPEIGEPKPVVIEFIKLHAARGAKIILHTCRENVTQRPLLNEAVEFCAAHGIPLYAVNENPSDPYPELYRSGQGRKLYADLYIDDKAVNVSDIEKERC